MKIAVCRLIDVCSQNVENPFSPLSEEGLKERIVFHTMERLCWGGGGTGNGGSVYVSPRSRPRHVEGEACIGEDGSGYSHQVRVHCALLLTGVPIMFVNGII